MTFKLDNVPLFNISIPVPDAGFKRFIDGLNEAGFALFVQRQPAWHGLEPILVDFSAGEQIDDGLIRQVPEHFH